MVTAVVLVCGLAPLAAAAVLVHRRYDAGAAMMMWSPFVRRAVTAGRLTPEQVRLKGARYCAIPASACAVVFAAAIIAATIASA